VTKLLSGVKTRKNISVAAVLKLRLLRVGKKLMIFGENITNQLDISKD